MLRVSNRWKEIQSRPFRFGLQRPKAPGVISVEFVAVATTGWEVEGFDGPWVVRKFYYYYLGLIFGKNHPELKTATSMRAASFPAF